jgi:hypothetical protein
VTSPASTPPERDLPDLAPDSDDRPSITETGGTVAHFEMSYAPPNGGRAVKFGPPLLTRIPSAIYCLLTLALGTFVLWAYMHPSASKYTIWVVEGDRERPLGAQVLTVIVVVSGIATVLRTHMRGVVVSEDWIEARYLLPMGIPRAHRWGWPQVTRLVVDGARIGLEFYDGTFERLPPVADERALADLMMHYAQKKKIHVTLLQR